MSYLLVNADARRIPLPDRSVHMCVTSPPYWGLRSYLPDGHDDKAAELGLEATPADFIAGMVAVFREVWRVLRDDGTAWVNMGDGYAAQRGATAMPAQTVAGGIGGKSQDLAAFRGMGSNGSAHRDASAIGLKHKDLLGMPWRLAFALQADGWTLRDAIIWAKAEVGDDDELEGSAMPGSQRDRCTSAYETVFQLSKKARYYYDHEGCKTKSGAILRNVWRINPEPTKIKHFATFPRELARRTILLSTSQRGVCPRCGAPWRRVSEVLPEYREWAESQRYYGDGGEGTAFRMGKTNSATVPPKFKHVGWSPGCTCDAGEPVPATVLDPFVGSGTSLVVAEALGRRGIGLDLSAEYLGMARRRLERPHAAVARPGREERHPLFEGAE